MDIKLVIVGRKVGENSIYVESEITKYLLKINDEIVIDLTHEILPTFTINFSTLSTKVNFELKNGEKFQNITIETQCL